MHPGRSRQPARCRASPCSLNQFGLLRLVARRWPRLSHSGCRSKSARASAWPGSRVWHIATNTPDFETRVADSARLALSALHRLEDDVHRLATVENTIRNLKSGIRLIRRSPSFSFTIFLTLALGIGANSAVFCAINAALLRPLPFPHADELVVLRQAVRARGTQTTEVAPRGLRTGTGLNSTFQAMSGWYGPGAVLSAPARGRLSAR